jgi:glycine/D-amino acid oxidase-like deaminating enzyme
VLGAGIVGTSIALHLAKRGLSVALIDRAGVGEQTSYGNAGVIEGNTVFPPAFPSDPGALARIALKRAGEANYHLSFLPQITPWLLAFRAGSRPQRLVENARFIRPLFARAVAEHAALMADSGATYFLRKTGLLKVYRSRRACRQHPLLGIVVHQCPFDLARRRHRFAVMLRIKLFWENAEILDLLDARKFPVQPVDFGLYEAVHHFV